MQEKPTVRDILLVLGVGAVVVGSILIPGLPRILYYFINENKDKEKNLARFNHRLFKQELNRLAKRGVVKFEEVDGKQVARLTEAGELKVKKYQLAELQIKRPKKWDGKWRLVIFDITDKRKVTRELLRQNLKNLGFYQLQKSVFIHPFRCNDEIQILREQYSLTSAEVMLLTVEDFEGEKIPLKTFGQ